MEAPTRLAGIADSLLRENHGTDLGGWLRERRDARRYYAELATELRDLTGGVVVVSRETLRRWDDHYRRTAA